MNRPHFRRHPRPVDPEPYTRLDYLDGLPGRASGGLIATGGTAIIGAGDRVYPLTRYDAQWPDVIAAETPPKWADLFGIDPEFVGGDLAAMAAPADWGEYDIEPESVTVHIAADVSRFNEAMAQAHAATTAAAKPRGRHRQTDPFDLILADLRDLDGL